MKLDAVEWLNVLEQIPVAVTVFLGKDLTIIGCSREQLIMWGRERQSIIGYEAKEVMSAERVELLRTVYESGKTEQNESLQVSFTRNGKQHTGYYSYVYLPWSLPNGQPAGVIALVADVSSTIHEQERSRALTENLLQLANAMPQLVWMADKNGVVTYYNDRLGLFHGAVKNLDGSWTWEGLVHKQDLEGTETAWQYSLESGLPYESEHRIMMADKSYRWHLSRALPQVDHAGNVLQWFGTATDIDDLKNAEDENRKKEKKLRASEDKFKKLAQSLPQMIWTSGEDGLPDFFNQTWYAHTGAPHETSAGKTWEQYIHPEDLEIYRRYVTYSSEIDTRVNVDIRVKSHNGTYTWFSLVFTPIENSVDGKAGMIATFSNVDDRKAMEEELKLLVSQRTAELERSNQDLTQFAHITSHDLKEPLRKMKSFGFRLEEELGNSVSEKALMYLGKIQNAAIRLSTMVDGILTYSKVDSTNAPFEKLDMKDLIVDILQDFELVMKEKHASVVIDELPPVSGIRVLIRQLFYNLINNALKFSKPELSPVIEISAMRNDEQQVIEYAIIDNGIGFGAEYAERIFETFFRLNSKDAYEGTGLGLALCRKIALRHGGAIRAESEEGFGSRFIVSLPIKSKLQ